MKVVILCGGLGTRIRDLTEDLPKPMIPIGGYPIVWHIMKHFSCFGFNDFVLCVGYKKEVFIDYFVHYRNHNSDLTVCIKDNTVTSLNNHQEDWKVTLADTGLSSDTGARVRRIEKYIDEDDFFMTYGDGLSNVDLSKLRSFHRRNKSIITVTAVHPSSRFGEIKISGKNVCEFNEKPQATEGYINGGYMMINKVIFKQYLNEDPNLDFEATVMAAVARDAQMAAFRHDGFWQSMDTSREYKLLNKLWEQGSPPWKLW